MILYTFQIIWRRTIKRRQDGRNRDPRCRFRVSGGRGGWADRNLHRIRSKQFSNVNNCFYSSINHPIQHIYFLAATFVTLSFTRNPNTNHICGRSTTTSSSSNAKSARKNTKTSTTFNFTWPGIKLEIPLRTNKSRTAKWHSYVRNVVNHVPPRAPSRNTSMFTSRPNRLRAITVRWRLRMCSAWNRTWIRTMARNTFARTVDCSWTRRLRSTCIWWCIQTWRNSNANSAAVSSSGPRR